MSIPNSTPLNITVARRRAKPIKIASGYEKQLQAALDAANGRARTHTFAGSTQLFRLAEAGERKLNALGVAKPRRKGAYVLATSGGTMPRAYKFVRELTDIRIERRAAGWYLTSVEKVSGYQGGFLLVLTPQQDAEAVETLRMKYEFAGSKPSKTLVTNCEAIG
jgi:hypothetical protein